MPPSPTHTHHQGYESTVITIVKSGAQEGPGENGKGGNKSSAVVVEDQVAIEV